MPTKREAKPSGKKIASKTKAPAGKARASAGKGKSPAGKAKATAGKAKARPVKSQFPVRYAILVVMAAPLLMVAVYFVGMLKTAEAREVTAACNSLQPTGNSKTISSIPTAAQDFELKNYRGESVKLSDYRGKVVLVNFWASWCKTCRSEKPSLESMAVDLGGDGVEVLALASDPDWEKVRGALPNGSDLTVLLDPPGEGTNFGDIATRYGIKAVPETFVVDKTGVIRHYIVNKRDWRSSVARTCIEALTRE